MKFCMLAIALAMLSSCWWLTKPHPVENYNQKVMGWRPVYGADTAYKKLTVSAQPRAVESAGKIYVLGNYIFQNETGKGIHVIDNTDPAHAHRVAFWGLPGNTEIAIKGSFLYANNFDDLVVIDISNHDAPRIVKRLKASFSTYNAEEPYPWQAPPQSGYYECPQQYTDSVIINWVADSVNQYCYKP